jgi:hypothetical protein
MSHDICLHAFLSDGVGGDVWSSKCNVSAVVSTHPTARCPPEFTTAATAMSARPKNNLEDLTREAGPGDEGMKFSSSSNNDTRIYTYYYGGCVCHPSTGPCTSSSQALRHRQSVQSQCGGYSEHDEGKKLT